MDKRITVLTNGEVERYAMNTYINGVTDGIRYTIGGLIVYKIGKILVKSYIDYKVEKGVEENKIKNYRVAK